MKRKKERPWDKTTLKMKPGNRWTARPGCKIMVADAGAVRIDIPTAWIVIPNSENIKIHDKQPPNDDCALTVSYVRLPPVDWTDLPIGPLLRDSTKETELEVTKMGPVTELRRSDLEIAWREMHFIDPVEKRDAISRICIGRRKLIQCLITFDFWLTDLQRCAPVWNTVLESLTVAEFVRDPTTGR